MVERASIDVVGLRRNPLGETGLDVRGPRLTITQDPFRTLIDVCGAGARLPSMAEYGAWAWQLGPDWWLVDAPVAKEPGFETPFAAQLREELGPYFNAIDVSAHRTTFVLRGLDALHVLSHGTSLDLHPTVYGVGACVQGLLARTQVILGCTSEEPEIRLFVRASFARHLAAWLVDASAEYV